MVPGALEKKINPRGIYGKRLEEAPDFPSKGRSQREKKPLSD